MNIFCLFLFVYMNDTDYEKMFRESRENMYQDTFIENFISRKKTRMTGIIKGILTIMTILTGIGMIFSLSIYLMIPFLMFLGFGYYYSMHTVLDFDYSFTNGIFEIDRVCFKRKRKTLFSIDLKEELIVIAPSKTEPVQPYIGKKMPTYDCTSHGEGVRYYTLIAKLKSHNGQEIKALFEPDDIMMSAIEQIAPSKVYKEI